MRVLPLHILVVHLLLSACASSIPPEFMRQVDEDLLFADLKIAPDQLLGKIFLLGGTVDERTDLKDMTRMRIRHRPLDTMHMPRVSAPSEGEFLVISRPPVNPSQYPLGARVTVVGMFKRFEAVTHNPQAGSLPSFEALFLRTWAPPPRNLEKSYNPLYGEPSTFPY
jgi:starvation-inducible outer membrane lipoprotein